MNLEQAKQAAIDAGYQGEPTAAVLAQFGWTPSNPLAGFIPSDVVVKPDQVALELAKLHEEATAAGVPAQIIAGIVRFGGLALGLIR